MATTLTRSPQGARAEMITDALQHHDAKCCSDEQPCRDRVKLTALLDDGQSPLSTTGTDVKPSFGKGTGSTRREVRYATAKQMDYIRSLLARVPADVAATYQADAGNAYLSAERASTVIEILQGKQGSAPVSTGASEAQCKFLATLLAQRDYYSLLERDRKLADNFIAGSTLSKADASRLIGELKVTAFSTTYVAPSATQSAGATEGMYKAGETIYKVQKAVHGSGNLYAKQLVVEGTSVRFEYAAGMVRKLTAADRLSLEEAKAFGQLYGTCCCCGRTLTDENSIAEGIGPICASKGFGD